jgi:hypothetical protein
MLRQSKDGRVLFMRSPIRRANPRFDGRPSSYTLKVRFRNGPRTAMGRLLPVA